MRIVIINTLYPPMQVGGAEKSVGLLAEALKRGGDEVVVISLHPGREMVKEELNGVRIYRLPIDNMYWPFGYRQQPSVIKRLFWQIFEMWNFRAAARVGAILDIEKPDVVHTNNIYGFSCAIWREVRRRKIRLVHTLRDYTLACLHTGFYGSKGECRKQCLDCSIFSTTRKLQSHKLDAVIGNSDYTLDVHKENGFFTGVPGSAIYNIGDFNVIQEDNRNIESRDGILTFGYIGMLEQKKGIEILLKATHHLSHHKWKLKIGGRPTDPHYLEELKRRFDDDRIEWLGFVRAQDFYKLIDVCVVPSLWPEPLPRTLIESFAYGRTAICAASGGIPEISHYGKNVAMYQPHNFEELASIMDRALSAPEDWMNGGFIDENARYMFAESTIRDKYRRVYCNR